MFISIPTFLSYLFLIGSACAQINVNVPNCTYENLTWVGYLRTPVLYKQQRSTLTGDHFLIIVVQFAPTKSLLSRSVPGGCVLYWGSVHLLLTFRVQSYRPL